MWDFLMDSAAPLLYLYLFLIDHAAISFSFLNLDPQFNAVPLKPNRRVILASYLSLSLSFSLPSSFFVSTT